MWRMRTRERSIQKKNCEKKYENKQSRGMAYAKKKTKKPERTEKLLVYTETKIRR